MQNNFTTARLSLNELTLSDTGFIEELVNTPEWIKFIGDRNIKNKEDATRYIQKLIDNPAINYWIVKTREQQIPIGIVTFIKRDYLDHYDIGFAFLSKYTRQGYAYEATAEVLSDAIKETAHKFILASTIEENKSSIHLLEKLGFRFDKEIKVENEKLLLYSASASHLEKILKISEKL